MADVLGVPATLTSNLSEAILTVYSKEILFEAQPVLRFDQFSVKRTELGVQPGLTINFLKYDDLTGDPELVENVPIETDSLSGSLIPLTVTEYAKAVSISEKLVKSSFDDVMSSASKVLGHHYGKRLDILYRNSLLTATNVKYAGSADDRASTTGSFDTTLIKDMAEVLATNDTPQVNGANWVCFVHPHQGRKLRDDSAWINASLYAGSRQIFLGEIGMYEDTLFIQTTQVKKLVASESTPAIGEDMYQAIMIGEGAYGHAIATPVEMRDNGVEDFGRKHSLAWYSIMGTGLIQAERVVIGESR